MDLHDPFDEKPNLTTRHLLRRRGTDHPLADVFEAKRTNDLVQRDALQAMADWTTGRASLNEVEQKVRQWQADLDSLVTTLKAAEHVVKEVSVRSGVPRSRRTGGWKDTR